MNASDALVEPSNGQPNKPRRAYTRHGLTPLLKAVSKRGLNAVDGRSALAIAARDWRAGLIADRGGPDEISTATKALIELAVRQWLIVESIDGWLFQQPSLINRRSRVLYPVVVQRQAASDALARLLGQLGLERRQAKEVDLKTYLAQRTEQTS